MLPGVSLYGLGGIFDAVVAVDPDDLKRDLSLYVAIRSTEIQAHMLEIDERTSVFSGEILGSMRMDGNDKVELACEIVDTTVNMDTRSDVLLGVRPANTRITDLGQDLTGHRNRSLFVMYWSFKTPDPNCVYSHDSNNTVLPFIAHVDTDACQKAGISEYVVARALLTNAFFGRRS